MPRTKGAVGDRRWSDAVRLAVSRNGMDQDGKTRKRLSIIADKLCTLAMEGDIQAIKEIGDRIEGKPTQTIQGPGENGEHLITGVEVTFVRPNPTPTNT